MERVEHVSPLHHTARVPFELHGNGEAGTFEGFASVFNVRIDTTPATVIEAGSFRRTLHERGHRVRLLWQHDPSEPIGRPLEMRETAKGLWIRGSISDTERGREAVRLMADGVITEMSIGFDPIRWEYRESLEGKLRHLLDCELWEISLVTWGANREAKITRTMPATAPAPRTESRAAPIDGNLSRSDQLRDLQFREATDYMMGMRARQFAEAQRAYADLRG